MDGTPYLYTLTLSCPDEEWPQLGPLYAQAQQTFRLTETAQVRTAVFKEKLVSYSQPLVSHWKDSGAVLLLTEIG